MFSVFKKYYTLFSHTFSLTHISKKTKNCVFKKTENSYLNTHTKWALNILKKKKKKKVFLSINLGISRNNLIR